MEVCYCLRGDCVFGLRGEHEGDEDVEPACLGLAVVNDVSPGLV